MTTHAVHSSGACWFMAKRNWDGTAKYVGEGGAKRGGGDSGSGAIGKGLSTQGAGASMVINDDTVKLITGKMFEGQNQPVLLLIVMPTLRTPWLVWSCSQCAHTGYH